MLVATTVGTAARAELGTPLFEIPVDPLPASAVSIAGSAPWRIALESSDPSALLQSLAGRAARSAVNDRVEVDVGAYVAAATAVQGDWLAATFLIDYRDAPVPDLVSQLRAAHPRPRPADVVAFVASTVTGSHDRSFDMASQVARNRRGDCTEFAVLTAALARAAGLPARVVLGVALVPEDARLGAYGHAWAEIDGGNGWQVADAALAAKSQSVRYVALAVVEDEGPGYMMSVVRPMSAWVRRVSVLEPN
jgi:transglutaminase-like putative cysteine protease